MSPRIDAPGTCRPQREAPGQLVEDTYLLTGLEKRFGKQSHYFKLSLMNANGTIEGILWPEQMRQVRCPEVSTPVSVRGRKHLFNDRLQLRIESLVAVPADEVPVATALLPRQHCTKEVQAALDRLAELERSLPCPLQGFLRQVLLDPLIFPDLMTCRASVSHHHAFPGGLLVHSTGLLDMAAELTRRSVPDCPRSPHLAQLGFLLHDLGKIRSVGQTRRPAHPFAMRHELVTIELLAPHLNWLERRDMLLAAGMRSLLDYVAEPHPRRRPAPLAAAEVVVMLDQLSAGTHNRRDLESLAAGRMWSARAAPLAPSSPSGRSFAPL